MSSKVEKIKDTIEKLYRKSVSAEELGSLQEAETFMAKAQELLTRYNLELADLNIEGQTELEAVIQRVEIQEIHGWSKSDGDWLISMYNTICHFNFCRLVSHGHSGVTLIGEQHNIDMVLYICSQVIPVIKRLRLAAWKQYNGPEKTNAFKRGYYRGAVAGIASKLFEQRRADEAKHEGLAGLVVTKDALVKEKVSEAFPKLGRRRSSRLSANAAHAMGFRDGKAIQINKGIN